ncbi:hypothetical protein T4B_12656 [Trichinella pseudospiralis]|uniref:Uncharacterized protein n=1 Tax=Trichinella pseudospiralis TaxID=6337 RepID=A0A0V1ILN7_TRIPS|nr:hypothetical protein T4B_12656 [Trichinella pseudospiralis]
MRVFRLSEVEYISRNLEKTENLPVGHLFQIYWIVSGEYSSENFENFKKMLFLQKWTKWILVDSEQSFKSNEGIPNLPG